MNAAPTSQLIVHVGDPKTGTTSIHRAFQKNLVDCHDRSLAHWERQAGKVNAIPLANALKSQDPQSLKSCLKKIREWVNTSHADIAVISSEYLSGVEPAVLQQALRDHLREHAETARVIAYVRPHASRFLSAFIQRTKTGRYMGTYQEFLPHITRQQRLYYAPRFTKWRQVFGTCFVLRPFIPSELRGQDVVHDFFSEILGDSSFTISGTLKENSSLSERALCGLRLFHKHLDKAGIKSRSRAHLSRTIYEHYLPRETPSESKPALDRGTAQSLGRIYADDAHAIDTAFFLRPLMQQALEAAPEKAVKQPINLTPAHHFNGYERKRLTDLCDEIAKLAGNEAPLWESHHQGHRQLVELTARQSDILTKNRARIAGMDARLTELAAVLAD